MALEMKRLNFNMDVDLVAKVDAFADEMHINRSSAISLMCSQFLDSRQLMSDLNKMMKAAEVMNVTSESV